MRSITLLINLLVLKYSQTSAHISAARNIALYANDIEANEKDTKGLALFHHNMQNLDIDFGLSLHQ